MNHLDNHLHLRGIIQRHRRLPYLQLHPVVAAVLGNHQPKDWHLLALEFPSISKDGHRVTYYRNEERAFKYSETLDSNFRTVTSPQKYVRRHFPQLKDHEVNHLTKNAERTYHITDDMDKMIWVVQNGPQSCMKWGKDGSSYGRQEWEEGDDHPYEGYDPKFGWKMAYAMQDGKVVARALINDDTFVKTYEEGGGEFADRSQPMEEWLESQGYCHRAYWKDGTRLAWNGDCMPYLDGSARCVSLGYNSEYGQYAYIESDGDEADYRLDSTRGRTREIDKSCCDDCGDRYSENDLNYIEDVSGDSYHICESCIEDWVEVPVPRSWGRTTSWIRKEDAIQCDSSGDWYDPDSLSDLDLVLVDGVVYSLDDVEYSEVENDYAPMYYINSSTQKSAQEGWVRIQNEHGEDIDICRVENAVWCGDEEGSDFYGWIHQDDAIEDFEGNWWHKKTNQGSKLVEAERAAQDAKDKVEFERPFYADIPLPMKPVCNQCSPSQFVA